MDQGCFHILAIVNSAAMNTAVHVPFSILVSEGYMTRSSIVGSYGGMSALLTMPKPLTMWITTNCGKF